ncbi:MAG TPA: 4a-hydroxytetrahydrobiopterin dehydratase [Gammaproteobacteria bacterium]
MNNTLADRHCVRIPKGGPALSAAEARALLAQLHPDWALDAGSDAIHRSFRFRDYFATLAFVNAVAWIAHREDHHPDLEVGYNRCLVRYSTHTVGGLSENDFICAARIDALDSAALPGGAV